MADSIFQLKWYCSTGVCPRGAQVRQRCGRSLNPLSSTKTIVRPSFLAFFLTPASAFASTARSFPHPAPGLARWDADRVVIPVVPHPDPCDAECQSGLSALEPFTNSFQQESRQHLFHIRTDWNVSPSNVVTFRYSRQNFDADNAGEGERGDTGGHSSRVGLRSDTFL